jgi:hypothetical protein
MGVSWPLAAVVLGLVAALLGLLVSHARAYAAGRDAERRTGDEREKRRDAEAALAARVLAEREGRIVSLEAERDDLERAAQQRVDLVGSTLAARDQLARAARPVDGGAPDHGRLLDAVAPAPAAGRDPRPAPTAPAAPSGGVGGDGLARPVAGDGAGAAPSRGGAAG